MLVISLSPFWGMEVKNLAAMFDCVIKIKINGHRIYPTSHIKYLGVYLDEHLDSSKHCLELELKLRCLNGMLYRISSFLSTPELISFYYALFLQPCYMDVRFGDLLPVPLLEG